MWSELLKVKYSKKQHASHVVFLFAEKRKTLKFFVEIANKEMRKIKGGMFMYVTGLYPWIIKWFLK
ncbi:hypothetical protein FOA33_09035 [Streptococcus cristatus]|uniref:hypothetical protein n=1 Tax=Streptococcus cristatus TaxID=45634 RepID=UPI001C840509|nr:hypothetical protein [Streptococcus cristatus]MBX5326079.1 hypothetical protein [Streptococcus cristatus]